MDDIGSGIFGSSPEANYNYGAFLDSSSKKEEEEPVMDFKREKQLLIESMKESTCNKTTVTVPGDQSLRI